MRMILYLLVFAVIMVIFYYQLGQALERTWGTLVLCNLFCRVVCGRNINSPFCA